MELSSLDRSNIVVHYIQPHSSMIAAAWRQGAERQGTEYQGGLNTKELERQNNLNTK